MRGTFAIAALVAAVVASATAAPEDVQRAPGTAKEPSVHGSASSGSSRLKAPAHVKGHERSTSTRWTSIVFASPLSCVQALVHRYNLEFGQGAEGDSALHLLAKSMGIGVIGSVPRLFLVILCTMISMVLGVTLWSIAFEGKDKDDPFSVGSRGVPAAQLQLQQPHRAHVNGPHYSRPATWRSAAQSTLGPPVATLCPALILPYGVAQFRIPVDSLHNLREGSLPVPILGPSGMSVLHAWLSRGAGFVNATPPPGAAPHDVPDGPMVPGGSGRRWLMLTTTTTSKHPHAKVGPFDLHCVADEPLEIRGPHNDLYGTLQCGERGWGVMHHGALVFFIDTSFPYPHLSAFGADGRPLATAAHSRGRTDEKSLHGAPDIECLTVSAKPGSDALLALLCCLAVVLMSPDFSTLGSRF